MSAYLFVHFTGTERGADSEQIYFSVSEDGTSWKRLNNNEPVLRSGIGTNGMRDPHIIRSPEGDKFYMIATDLSVYNINGDWGMSQTAGSKSIVVYESDDLVNWSEPRLVEVGTDDAGCVWAPESVYDNESGRYMVFWASRVGGDNYKKQRVYRCYTEDFVTFTEPEVYIDYPKDSIDTTFAYENGVYYRFTKNEAQSSVIMEKGASLDGAFEEVATYTLDGAAGNTIKGITKSEYDALTAAYPADGTEMGEVVFEMGFDDETAIPETGEAEVNGEFTYTAGANGGKAAVLDNNDYIKITADKNGNNLLAGLDSFTVSLKVKANSKSWLFFAAPNDDAPVYRSEKYAGIMYDNSYITCERYNSNNVKTRPASAGGNADMGEWQNIAVVYADHMTVLYINGEEVSRRETVDLPAMLGDSPVVYVGKSTWGGGEYSDCAIDDVRIYNYALKGEEVASL